MRIVHLSDIHFRKRDFGSAQDPNSHLRNELLRDLVALRRQYGAADLVVVSGDIAFAGDPEEFTFATDWLKKVCETCGADFEATFVIPGNHDVDRKVADGRLVKVLHDEIKRASELTVNDVITGFLSDEETSRPLYRSLDSYNLFAGQFFCSLLPPNRTRIKRDLVLNDGSTLRLWGLNTAFVSSSADREGDLFIDEASLQIPREDGVTNMVIAHHHLSWLRQKQSLEDHLGDVAPIQVFGHIHTNRISMNRDYIRLTASATHPDRYEHGWEPGYNFLEIDVEGTGANRGLHVRAHVRIWQQAPGGFRAKTDRSSDVFDHRIALEPWERSPDNAMSPVVANAEDFASTEEDAASLETKAVTLMRDIGIRFYGLSFSQKAEIAGRLALFEEGDIRKPDFERFRQVIIRAHERNKLEDLKRAVEEAEKGRQV